MGNSSIHIHILKSIKCVFTQTKYLLKMTENRPVYRQNEVPK